MFTEKEQKNFKEFNCEICKFTTCKLFDFKRHLLTAKHKMFTNNYKENEKNEANKNNKKYQCDCGKIYNYRQSLYVHKKNCKGKFEKDNDFEKEEKGLKKQNDLVTFLLKENSELKGMILEVCKNMKSIITTNTNSNNNNNTTFNLQFFLNETCKDAINLSEFVDSIKLELSDLENVGTKGYIVGISDIILKNLKPLDITMRPVHCSDLKREVVYVKEENVWSNDSKENQKLKKAIKQVTNKNIGIIKEWKDKYPDCINSDSRKSDIYNQIIGESMDHNTENSEKIIKKIVKEITIDKNILNK